MATLADDADHGRAGDGGLPGALAATPDPRQPPGARHQITTVPALAVGAVLAGCRLFTVLGEQAAGASEQVISPPGMAGCAV